MKKLIILTFIVLVCTIITINADAGYGETKVWLSRVYAGDNGSPKKAYLDFAEDVLFKSNGTMIIADTYNNVIRQISNNLNNTKTLAGTGSYGNTDGYKGRAEFGQPRGIAISGNTVFVADTWNHRIKKISGNSVSTIIKSGLYFPEGVEVHGSTVYIADTGHGAIKKTTTNGAGFSTLVQGHGLVSPEKLRMGPNNKYLYVADTGAHKIFKVNASNGHIETFAGSSVGYKEGIGKSAKFKFSAGVVIDKQQNCLFVTDGNGYKDYVRKIDLSTKKTEQYAVDSDIITLNYPKGLDIKNSYIYVANSGISSIQRFNRYTGITKEKGDKVVGKKRFEHEFGKSKHSLVGRPKDMVFGKKKKWIYVAENNLIRKIKRKGKRSNRFVGNVVDAYKEGIGTKARFSSITALTIDKSTNSLYVADRWNNRIRKVNTKTKQTELITGSGKVDCTGRCNGYREGTKNTALFSNPSGIVLSKNKKVLFVTDSANNRVRKVRISDGKTWLIAGSGGTGLKNGFKKQAVFNRPYAITRKGKKLYVADSYNNCIREIDPKSKQVSILAGNGDRGYRDGYGKDARFSTPNYVRYSKKDKKLYISEAGTHKIRVINPKNGLVKTIAGTDRGYKNGNKFATEFNNPSGILPFKKKGKLFVADTWNDLIRVIDIKGKAQFYQPGPVVYGLKPNNRYPFSGNPAETKYLDIVGDKFSEAPTGYFGDYKANRTFLKNSKELTVIIPFGKMPRGLYNVTVQNIDGQKNTKYGAFEIY